MPLDRRHLLASVAAVAGSLTTAACTGSTTSSSSSSSSGRAATGTGSLAFPTAAWRHDADNDVYYQLGVDYVTSPGTLENLGVYVPGAYLSATDNGDGTFTCAIDPAGTVAGFTAATAPVVLPVNTPGYAAQQPPSSYSYDTVKQYLAAGFVYVQAGLRGKDSSTDGYDGNAPWGVTDLKAAVRYLRYNAQVIPGSVDRIFVFGHSGGGAQSSVMGASGDSDRFTPYLRSLGAAMTDASGATLSDAVAGVMAWCPITSLDAANAAYEWNLGQFATSGTRADGTWTKAYSTDLAEAYAGYVNRLGLKDANGTTLALTASGTGTYLAGTYYDHVMAVMTESLNNFLADTTFPYTPSTQEMAGMGTGGPSGGTPSGAAPSRSAPGGSAPSGSAPSASSTAASTTYATVADYLADLNADGTWVTYDAATNRATISSLGALVASQKPASKNVGAMDRPDRSATENLVLGKGTTKGHFSTISRDVMAAKESTYAGLTGWDSAYAASGYDSDFTTVDAGGLTSVQREQMYDPLTYLTGGATSTVAKSWRIRTGLKQGDTASTVEINLALALRAAGHAVDFATVWGQGHTMAERTGDGATNFIAWVRTTVA